MLPVSDKCGRVFFSEIVELTGRSEHYDYSRFTLENHDFKNLLPEFNVFGLYLLS